MSGNMGGKIKGGRHTFKGCGKGAVQKEKGEGISGKGWGAGRTGTCNRSGKK